MVSFADATRLGVDTLADPAAAAQARRMIDEIASRRAAEESD